MQDRLNHQKEQNDLVEILAPYDHIGAQQALLIDSPEDLCEARNMATKTIDPAEITAKGCRWVRAADDRIIEYSVSGSQLSDARVLASGYFAGMPDPASWKKAYEELNIKVIDVSYPGLGLSSLHPGRTVAEWPKTDLEPVLAAEGVQGFTVYGTSYGTIHAMAVAQYFGPERVTAMGLRVPYFGLPLSNELGLPNGQPRFPTSDELLRNTFKVKVFRRILDLTAGVTRVFFNPGRILLPLMKSGVLGGQAKGLANMCSDYPAEFEYVKAIPDVMYPHGGTPCST